MFFEKFAKLNSTIDVSGSDIMIKVFDDELETNNPVMWINANYTLDGSQSTKIRANGIYFSIIDFDNEIFSKMPESRQDSCATAALKRFIKWYNQDHGRNSDNWLPVYANFANYKIQQKFEAAVEKGIFPPESLEMSKMTTEDKWKADPYYNRENRQTLDQLREDINNRKVDISMSDDMTDNVPISQVQAFLDNYNVGHVKIEGYLAANGDVFCMIPGIGDSDEIVSEYGYFAITESLIVFDPLDFDVKDSQVEVTNAASRNVAKIQGLLDTITTVKFGSQGEEIPFSEWITQLTTQASTKRLMRKRG